MSRTMDLPRRPRMRKTMHCTIDGSNPYQITPPNDFPDGYPPIPIVKNDTITIKEGNFFKVNLMSEFVLLNN